ncbi:MAG: carboxypeptidase regulatory-like domain-containing protein [Deltaproteobacteria bacterium]|nr:carboxypeptidase regulatory-like domain-containing protein [Deltaproteobacteria bacterium]
MKRLSIGLSLGVALLLIISLAQAEAGGVGATQTGYLDEWWAASVSSPDCIAVQAIPLATDNVVTGAVISGSVTDLLENPLIGIHVDAVDNRCDGIWHGAVTDENGNYTIHVPEGTYYVRAYGAASQQNYIVEWWDTATGTSDCHLAAPVTATAGQPTEAIDFDLAHGGFVSGRVTDAQGNPMANLHVFAVSMACGGNWLGGTETDQNGDYQLTGMPGGEIYVTACGWCSRLPYVSEWYNNVTDCNLATPVPVTVEQVTENIDFSLEQGGIISGRVADLADQPLSMISIDVVDHKCDGNWYGAATEPNGEYGVVVPPGDYYVRAYASPSHQNYLLEWWDGLSGAPDCNLAAPVTATVGGPAGNIDFALAPGGSVSGKVTDADGNGIANVHMAAHSQACGGNWLGGTETDQNGDYRIAGLPQGDNYIHACASCSGLSYANEWYDNVVNCNEASPVVVAVGQDYPGVNFSLEEGGSISGFVYAAEDGVTPIAGATVGVEMFTGGWGMGAATTGPDGSYTLTNLPTGEYRVNAWAEGRAREYWQDVLWHHLASPVSVAGGEDTANITFTLGPGGSISGQVATANPGALLANISVEAHRQGDEGAAGVTTLPDGTYTIAGLPFGDYKVNAPSTGRWGSGDDQYAIQYHDHQTDPNSATLVSISPGLPNATGINFDLSPGGAICGHVYEEDGITPIYNVHVYAVDQTTGSWMAYANTGRDGSYSLVLPTGTYRVRACPACNGLDFIDEWFDDELLESDATPVSVTAPNDTPNIDFSLTRGGTIQGRVTDLSGHGLPDVCVMAFANRCWQDWSGSGQTDAEGNYTFRAPAGAYYVVTHAACQGPSIYVDEWWNGAQGTVNCNNAVAVNVILGQTTGDIGFALQEGGRLSGTVTSDATGDPIEGVQICARPFPGGPGPCTMSQPDGRYTLSGVMPGYLWVRASGGGYLTEYYDNSYDPDWATAVWAAQGQPTGSIDFSMGTAGSISGTIYQSDGVTPLPFACVGAYMHPCASNRFAGAQADENGNYTIPGLPPQDYYLRANAACAVPQHYELEWWNTDTGTLACDQAGAVAVNSGRDTPGIDFSLNPSDAVYPGPAFNWAHVFSAHQADGTVRTIFVASITGPGPEDVASFTVTGPSGLFHLSLNQTPFRQLGNFYSAGLDVVADDGTYKFTVTDSLGRIATVEREFTYDSTLPQVDVNTMKVNGMDDYAYVGTATPTLTWAPVEWPGAPGYYQAFVYDYDGRAIWYYGTTEGTSVAVPEGFLQPDTAYYWWVRTCDIPESGESGQNRRYSETRYFYTGTMDTPDLSNSHNMLLSYFTPDNGWANWFGITRTNLAPWDIGFYNVAGPEGTVYNYNGHVYMFWHPMFYHCWAPGPAPMPEGTYAFELEDREGNRAELNKDFVHNPAAPIPEETRFPAANAYAYTATPTFRWSAPAVEAGETEDPIAYYYNLRIYDYHSRVHLYSSPTITETSFTLPEEVVRSAPPGAYKWEIRVYSDTTHDNAVFSSRRTINLPPLSRYDYALPTGTGDPMDYVLFTVPLYMGKGADLLKALEEQLGAYDPPTPWRIFGYDVTRSGDYIEINSDRFATMNIEPGMAYWIISVFADKSVQLEGAPATQTTYYERKLHPGWNLFSLPWPDTNIDLGNIAVSDGVHTYWLISQSNNLTLPYIWGFDREYVLLEDAGDVVEAGKGFWIKVSEVSANPPRTVKVLIPPDNNGGHFPVDGGPEIVLPSVRTYELPPPPPGGYPAVPAPDVKANGEDGTVTVPSGTRVSVAIGLDPGEQAGQWADWWVAARTPFGWFSYVHPNGWQPGIHWAAQAPLFTISPLFDVLNMPLPAGSYTFYFAVDNNMDANPDATYVDSVDVRVE